MTPILNLPTDTELLDVLEELLQGRTMTFAVRSRKYSTGLSLVKVGNAMEDISFRIGLRGYLQRRK